MERRRTIAVEAALPDVASGLRAAVATVVPFYFAAATGRRELLWAAIGGWLGTRVDPGGSRMARLRVLAAFAVIGAGALAIAERAASRVWLGTLVLACTVFLACLLRALGASMSLFGTMISIVVAIGVAREGPPDRGPLYFAAGAAWATVLSTVLWPIWTYLPVRRALGHVFEAMAAYARALGAHLDEPAPLEEAWTGLARRHRRRIRETIEAAREMSVAVRARRSVESRVGGNLSVLLGVAEAQFPLLIALSEDAATLGPPERAAVQRALRTLQERYDAVRASLVAVVASKLVAAPVASEPEGPDGRSPAPAEVLAERLLRASQAAVGLSASLGEDHSALEQEPGAPPHPLRAARATLAESARTLRAALWPASPYLRHAARVTLATTFAALLGNGLAFAQPHWLTISTIVVLQPFPATTWKRAAERGAGTALGCALAVAISVAVRGSPHVLAALLFPLSVAALAVRPRSYWLFIFFVTPVFVLIAERSPGGWWTAAARAGDTLMGGGVALIAALAIFPSWEQRRLPDALTRMLGAARAYAAAIFDQLSAPKSEADEAIVDPRRACGMAMSEAEAALERWFAEPIGRREGREEAVQLITYTRRLTGALTALDVVVHDGMVEPERRGRLASERSAHEARAFTLRCLEQASTFARSRRHRSGGEVLRSAPPRISPRLDAHVRLRLERVVAHAALLRVLTVKTSAAARPSDADERAASRRRRHELRRRIEGVAVHKAAGRS